MKSLAESFAKLRRLSSRERWFLAHAWLLLLVTDLALRVLPFATVLDYCRCPGVSQDTPLPDLPTPVARLAWLVEVAGRYCPAGTSCLKEALVLSWFLARRGVPTTLRVGVGRHEGAFSAHAWLEQDGRIVLGGPNCDAYAPLSPLQR